MNYIVQSRTGQLWAENIPVEASTYLIPMSLDCHSPLSLHKVYKIQFISLISEYVVRKHDKSGSEDDVKNFKLL